VHKVVPRKVATKKMAGKKKAGSKIQDNAGQCPSMEERLHWHDQRAFI